MSNINLSEKIALVTGASRGIGRQIALQLAQSGAHIIAIARTVGGLEELDDEIKATGGSATLVPLDLNETQAIEQLGVSLYERFGRLDVFIANAGILGVLSPLGHIKPKTWDETILTNLSVNWHLIRSLEPLLKQSKQGRAVFITSSAAQSCRPFWGAYAASKAGLDALVKVWAAECENISNLKINLFNPGATATKMRQKAMPGEDQSNLPSANDVAIELLKLCDPKLEKTGCYFDFPSKQWRDA